MPMFFFHLRAPGTFERDEEGLQCPDFETAYLEAYRAIPDLTAEFIRQGRDPMDLAFEITDADDQLLFEMPFTELVRGEPKAPRPHPEALKGLSQVERAYDLVASVKYQIEKLQKEMQVSREWLKHTRGLHGSTGNVPF